LDMGVGGVQNTSTVHRQLRISVHDARERQEALEERKRLEVQVAPPRRILLHCIPMVLKLEFFENIFFAKYYKI